MKLDPHFHVCALFGSRDEQHRMLAHFFQGGLDAGEKVFHFVERDDHRAQLEELGVDVEDLAVLRWERTCFRDEGVDPERMLEAIVGLCETSREQGFARARLVAQMDALAVSDAVVEYEARVNEIVASKKQPMVCVYDAQCLTGAALFDVLRAHPLVLVNGMVRANALYTPPEQLVREVRLRLPSPAFAA